MVFPDDLGEDPKERDEFREAWFEIAEDEEVDEDEISVSDTRDGSDPTPGMDDGDVFGDGIDEMMHEEDSE